MSGSLRHVSRDAREIRPGRTSEHVSSESRCAAFSDTFACTRKERRWRPPASALLVALREGLSAACVAHQSHPTDAAAALRSLISSRPMRSMIRRISSR
jgi:hypothetical protein